MASFTGHSVQGLSTYSGQSTDGNGFAYIYRLDESDIQPYRVGYYWLMVYDDRADPIGWVLGEKGVLYSPGTKIVVRPPYNERAFTQALVIQWHRSDIPYRIFY